MALMSKSKYAEYHGVSRQAVYDWEARGLLVLEGNKINVEASDARLQRYRAGGAPAVKRSAQNVNQQEQGYSPAGASVNHQPVSLTVREVIAQLEALDWKHSFDWSKIAEDERARQAAKCVGWEAVQSEQRDDGHWGGFQLRDAERISHHGLDEDAIIAGYGFELLPFDVLKECRYWLTVLEEDGDLVQGMDDTVTVIPALLPLLAHPFAEWDEPR